MLKVSAASANVPGHLPFSDLHLRVLHVPFIRESFQLCAYYSQPGPINSWRAGVAQQIPPERSHLYNRRLNVSTGFTAGDFEKNGSQEMSSLF